MAINFQCPCGRPFSVADGYAGQKLKCPSCKVMVEVPRASTLAHKPLRAPPPTTGAIPVARPLFYGVRGWLLFFCIMLTVLTPLASIVFTVWEFAAIKSYVPEFPGLMRIAVIESVVRAGLTVFSVLAGVALWRVKPYAVQLAKAYLVTVVVSNVIVGFLPLGGDLPTEVTAALIKEGLKGALYSAIWCFSIWLPYLNKSKRVKATFGISG